LTDKYLVEGREKSAPQFFLGSASWTRIEVPNGHEKRAVGFHHGAAPGCVIALLRKSPAMGGLFALCRRLYGCPDFISKNTKVRSARSANHRLDLGEQITVRLGDPERHCSRRETSMADTIKTATILIEEGKLMPESLQFESEPWTPFYMAGEIIRESRQASGIKTSTRAKGAWLIRTK
jgi:hypothetical protein